MRTAAGRCRSWAAAALARPEAVWVAAAAAVRPVTGIAASGANAGSSSATSIGAVSVK